MTSAVIGDQAAADQTRVEGRPAGGSGEDAGAAGALVDVVQVAWVAAGRPRRVLPGVAVILTSERCARCGACGSGLVDVRQVVSRSFTARDGWVDPGGSGLCGACSWVYGDRQLRRVPHLVQRAPVALTALNPATLGNALSRQVGAGVAVTVPRSGRKHLLPTAQWGRVLLDDIAVPWRSADAARLGRVRVLRDLGAGDNDLRQPAPPWPLVHAVGPQNRGLLLGAWEELRPWRDQQAYLDIALIATRCPRDPRGPRGALRRIVNG